MSYPRISLAPAAALSATATDMANFMIAQLQDGQFGNRRILQAATARAMHQQNFRNDPRVNGFAHGFVEATLNATLPPGSTSMDHVSQIW